MLVDWICGLVVDFGEEVELAGEILQYLSSKIIAVAQHYCFKELRCCANKCMLVIPF